MGYWISLLHTPLISQIRIDMLLTVLWRGGSQGGQRIFGEGATSRTRPCGSARLRVERLRGTHPVDLQHAAAGGRGHRALGPRQAAAIHPAACPARPCCSVPQPTRARPRELAEAAAVASATSPALERHCCSPDGPGPAEPPRRWGAGWAAGPPLERVPPLG
jgi:hypothetical protein